MPKKRKRPRKPPQRRPHGARPRRDDGDLPDLLTDVRSALREPNAFQLLAYASSLLAALDPRSLDPFDRDGPAGPTEQEIVASFLDVDLPETTALLTAFAAMTPDDLLARRIRRELATRDHDLPRWLRELTPIEVGAPVGISHVLGDGDDVILPVRTGGGDDLTVLVYVDHNLGTAVKDAFVVDVHVSEVLARHRRADGDDPDVSYVELDPADARARIAEAIETGAMTYPPFVTDSWPACRPFVEWVARQLPIGGTGYVRPRWDDADRDALAARFFDSPLGRPHDGSLARDQLDWILWFACDYGPGDPLRWSSVAVEILLVDWLPRKVVAPARELAGVPDLLRSFVRFAHDERGVRPSLTAETLDGIDRFEPTFQATIRGPRLQGPAALLAAAGFADADALLADADALFADESEYDWRGAIVDYLADHVGGTAALAALDDRPLPPEPFDEGAVPVDLVARVGEVRELTDRCCEAFFDAEHRTACHRLLADVVHADPSILRRGRTDTAAAAVVWLVAKANDSFDSYTGGLTVGELLGWFGITGSVSQRANTMRDALDVPRRAGYAAATSLGSPRYLVSGHRRELIARRDRLQEDGIW